MIMIELIESFRMISTISPPQGDSTSDLERERHVERLSRQSVVSFLILLG